MTVKKKRSLTKPILKSFNCPNCGSPLKISAVGLTVNVACPSCKSVIDVTGEEKKILEARRVNNSVDFTIPLGKRGKLAGHQYECIGRMQRDDSGYSWNEYLLYNPYLGFRWLMEMNGHWSFIKRVRDVKDFWSPGQGRIRYKKKKFKLFNRGTAVVTAVEGEFYWRVKVGDTTQMHDYIAPPYMLSFEFDSNEQIWSLGTYLTKERVDQAFDLKGDLPWQEGVAPNQPHHIRGDVKFTGIAVLFCLFIQFIGVAISSNKLVYQHSFDIPAIGYRKSRGADSLVRKTDEFEVESDGANIKAEVNANVRNSWIYLDTLLVDATTGQGLPLHSEVSYYYGSDWKEGSHDSTVIISGVPRGRYYLSIKPTYSFTRELTYSVRVFSDAPIISNLFWALGLIVLAPLFALLRVSVFENKRWQNSSEVSHED